MNSKLLFAATLVISLLGGFAVASGNAAMPSQIDASLQRIDAPTEQR